MNFIASIVKSPNFLKIDWHDIRVVLFHVIVAAAQGALIQLGKENFGSYTPIVALGIQAGSELLRRFII